MSRTFDSMESSLNGIERYLREIEQEQHREARAMEEIASWVSFWSWAFLLLLVALAYKHRKHIHRT